MRRPLLRLWLAGSAFSAVLALGCNHFEPSRLEPVAVPEPQTEDETEDEGEPIALPGGTVPASFREVAAAPAPAGPGPLAPMRLPDRPVVEAPAPLRLVRLTTTVRPPESLRTELVVLDRPRSATAPVATPNPPVPRPAFAHAADYRWLVGRLELRADNETWSVRYAPADENERHDGSLTLVSPGPMHGFRDGQFVRVEGELVDPAPHEIKPGYRVRAIQVLERH